MAVNEEVYNFLLTVSTLTAYIGTRLYWVDDPSDSSYPKVVFKELTKPTKWLSVDQWQRWRFYILAEDKFVCQAIGDIIKSSLNESYGTFGTEEIDNISHINDEGIELREDGVYELIQDYRVSYH